MKLRTTAKQRRTLSRRMTRVTSWWTALPYPKPRCLTPGALRHLTGLDMQRLAPSLRALGWQRILRRVSGKPTTLWLPPGTTLTKRPRGRPAMRHALITSHTFFEIVKQ